MPSVALVERWTNGPTNGQLSSRQSSPSVFTALTCRRCEVAGQAARPKTEVAVYSPEPTPSSTNCSTVATKRLSTRERAS
jgi:hypothetical protein